MTASMFLRLERPSTTSQDTVWFSVTAAICRASLITLSWDRARIRLPVQALRLELVGHTALETGARCSAKTFRILDFAVPYSIRSSDGHAVLLPGGTTSSRSPIHSGQARTSSPKTSRGSSCCILSQYRGSLNVSIGFG